MATVGDVRNRRETLLPLREGAGKRTATEGAFAGISGGYWFESNRRSTSPGQGFVQSSSHDQSPGMVSGADVSPRTSSTSFAPVAATLRPKWKSCVIEIF